MGYYGAQVAAPVFKKIAKKIYTGIAKEAEISMSNLKIIENKLFKSDKILPNMIGAETMDAIAFLEKRKIKVQIKGKRGKIKEQSVAPGTPLNNIKKIRLTL